MSGSLFGKSFVHWKNVDDVMDAYKLHTSADLSTALQALHKSKKAPKPDPMAGRVLVVDSKNNDRVLGSIPRPRGNSPKLDGGDCYNMAVMGRLSTACFDPYAKPDFDTSVQHVRFGFRCVNWTVVLTTDAGLDLLTRIEDFRLPGEDREQAHVRQMYAR